MKLIERKYFVVAGLAGLVVVLAIIPRVLRAQPQWPFAPPPGMPTPTTPDAQRNALSNLRTQVGWLQNATRTAPNYNSGGVGLLWQQFQVVRASYQTFTTTLNPQQQAYGANDLAELSAGLDILQESFTNYQNDVASGRSPDAALSELCQVLRQAAGVWLQELNKDCGQLRVGW
jgi:hypothetical protein